jgi:hypothetical protein
MSKDIKPLSPEELELASSLMTLLSEFAQQLGKQCLKELPRHMKFNEKLDPVDIQRETMMAVLFSTESFLSERYGIDIGKRIITSLQERFCTECLGGSLGEFTHLSELVDNRFARYEKARKDPMAKNETMRSVMMGIVAACSLGLEDNARVVFATHVGTHVFLWSESLKRLKID